MDAVVVGMCHCRRHIAAVVVVAVAVVAAASHLSCVSVVHQVGSD
jgi:hypothetical protein